MTCSKSTLEGTSSLESQDLLLTDEIIVFKTDSELKVLSLYLPLLIFFEYESSNYR